MLGLSLNDTVCHQLREAETVDSILKEDRTALTKWESSCHDAGQEVPALDWVQYTGCGTADQLFTLAWILEGSW